MYRSARNAAVVANLWGKTLKQEDSEWYDFHQIDDDTTEIRIYDVIGWPFMSADEFARDLANINTDNIIVAINSPGGDIFDGSAIYNQLKEHSAHIITRIDGIAASMASIIAMAGDEVIATDNAYFMIHDPWSCLCGDERDFIKVADFLSRVSTTLAENYVRKTGKSLKDIRAMMQEETWFIGQEIVDEGFADTLKGDSEEPKARASLGLFDNVPGALKSQPRQFLDEPPTAKEFERILRDSGYTRKQATAIAACGYQGIYQSDSEEAIEAIDKLNQTLIGDTTNG